ncbi:MAG TPA: DciA family protein [Rhodoblastus sp.]|nr:DciA family protein [Rhodoblastus sp.]
MPPTQKPPRSRPVPLADLVGGAFDPALAKRGFGQSSLFLHWENIAGERLAAFCEPIKLQWPPRPGKGPPEAPPPATLVLRVAGAMGLEIQHMAPVLIERVNAHLGWRAVGALAYRQGPLTRSARPGKKPPPKPQAVARAEKAMEGVGDEALRKALVLLGARVIGDGPRRS